MIFFKKAFSAIKWVLSVLRAYVRTCPATTTAVVGLSVLSRIANVLAFLMPLKVILLAGSDGVPRYFRFFITVENKSDWILGLAAASVVSYVLTLLFDELSGRLSESGSADVLKAANKLALVGKQRALARSNYAKVTQTAAFGVFALVGLVALVFVNTFLASVFLTLIVVELLLTAFVLSVGDSIWLGGMKRFIEEQAGDYLQILSSINFLVIFFIILMPFLVGEGGNILLAILSFLIVRRVLPALRSAVINVDSLYGDRHLIDPLVFRKRQSRKKESPDSQTIRVFFEKTSRQVLAAKHLGPVCPDSPEVDVSWQDSPISGVYTFVIGCGPEGRGEKQYYQQQVFPPMQVHLLGREDLLFSMIKRRTVHAPDVVARFREGTLECQICAYGPGKAVPAERYNKLIDGLVADLWCFEPPAKVVSAFSTGRASLPGRLTSEFVQRLSVAADSSSEKTVLETFEAKLPEVRARLGAVPLHVYNPDIRRTNIVEYRPGDARIMSWARWAIEPIGIEIPKGVSSRKLPDVLERVKAGRKGRACGLTVQDVEFVGLCRNIELSINRGKYKAALKSVDNALACMS